MNGLPQSNIINKDQLALLLVEEMAEADQITIHSGILGADLMEAAGLSVTRHIMSSYGQAKVLVLCGPGNNGGDGFVIARHLKNAGWDVELALLGTKDKLTGDAALMADQWDGPVLPLKTDVISDHAIIVDAIFGAGLCRPITGELAQLIKKINDRALRVVAVDVPSGLDGNSGQVKGVAFTARSTVTFFRRKPGHLLLPGRQLCGDVEVTDIGISSRVIDEIAPKCWRNAPGLWRMDFPRLATDGHKYNRGHVAVISGGVAEGGAARLAAMAALRLGAGLVSVSCPEQAVQAHAAQLNAVMIKPFQGRGHIDHLLADRRVNCWCVGPGNGVTDQTRQHVLNILKAGRDIVVDADGLSVFMDRPNDLFAAIHQSAASVILTPHDGEFARLFPGLAQGEGEYSKLLSARMASKRAGAVIIMKGPDTVIAAPDGRAVINDNAPPTLATAGAGDVLAGFCAGLLGQEMPSFEAACAAVWLHGAAAEAFGPGLISEDITTKIPEILSIITSDF